MYGTMCANYLHLSQTMPAPDPLLASMPMFSPGDSKHLLTASGDQSVKLWDVVSGELLFSWNMPGCGGTFLTRTACCACMSGWVAASLERCIAYPQHLQAIMGGMRVLLVWISLYWDKMLVECIDRAHTRPSMVHTLSARFPSCAALPAVSSGLRASDSSRC